MRDLWPEDIGPIPDLKSPATLLKEQASLLGKKTNNLIEAEVRRLEKLSLDDKEFIYDFFIVAPTLDNYRYKLFVISYDIDLYPVTIDVDGDILAEVDSKYVEDNFKGLKRLVAKSESDFLEILKNIFNSRKTRKVIGTLLSMINTEIPNSD